MASAPEREATRKAPTVSWDDASPPPRKAEPAPPRGPPESAAEIAAAARSSEDDARPPANDDIDDDLPPQPIVKQEPQPVTGLNVFAVKWHAKRAADLAAGRAYLVPETSLATAWANLAPGLRAVFEDRARSLNANVG